MSKCSGILAENLVELSANNPMRQWYQGDTLIDAIDAFKIPARCVNKSMRAIITAVVKESRSTCDINVKVLRGRLVSGRGVGIGNHSSRKFPLNTEGCVSERGLPFVVDVKKIFIEGNTTSTLFAGQNGTISLQDRGGLNGESMCLKEGMVLYKGPPVLRKCRKFRAKIQTMRNLAVPIISGSVFDLYLHGEEMQCFIKRIYAVTCKKELSNNTRCIPANSSAVVKIKTDVDAFLEVFNDFSTLGRFALRTRGVTSAVGICLQCCFSEEN